MNIQTMASFFKSMDIKQATINMSSILNEDEEYEYIQLNDNEFQFGRVGDLLTNYTYIKCMIYNDELIRKVDNAMCSINKKEYDEAMSTLKDVMVQLMSA